MRLRTTVLGDYTAALTSLTLVTAPSGGVNDSDKSAIRVHRIVFISQTSSGNLLTVAVGSQVFLRIASLTANLVIDTGFHEKGILASTVETALIASSTAGPAGMFYVTYSIE